MIAEKSRAPHLFALLLAVALVGSGASVPAIGQVVPNDVPVGTCVTAYGHSGRIVSTTPGGYRIASDDDPSGTPFVAAASGTTRSACKGGAQIAPARAPDPLPPGGPRGARTPKVALPAGRACFASTTGGLGGQAATYARLIIGNWAAPAAPGSDGAVTVKVNSLRVGASRRATFYDRDNASLDPRMPVTPVIANVTTCTDYRTRLDMREITENFLCYTKGVGGLSCGEIAHTADLAQPRTWSIDK